MPDLFGAERGGGFKRDLVGSAQVIEHSDATDKADLMQHTEERRINHDRGRKVIGVVMIWRDNDDRGREKAIVTIRIRVVRVRTGRYHVTARWPALCENRPRGHTHNRTTRADHDTSTASPNLPRQSQNEGKCNDSASHPIHIDYHPNPLDVRKGLFVSSDH